MKRHTIRCSVVAFFLISTLLFITRGLKAQTVINFDTDPSGNPIASGTVVNSVYASKGITFEKVGPGTNCGSGPDVYANDNQPAGFGSSPNVVSTCGAGIASDISELAFGMIHAILAGPANSVCIDVHPDGATDFAVLRSYDTSDNPLGSATSTPGVTETLCIPGTAIRGVRFSGSGSGFARFDNLSVTFVGSTLTGTVLYNGAPITNYTNTPVTLWARDENTGQPVPSSPQYNNTDGTYSIPDVPPGEYGISVYIDDAAPFDGQAFPWDYNGWNSPIEVPVGQAVVNRDLACEKLIHLISPVDNLSEIGYAGAYFTYYRKTMLFAWEAIAEASIYRIRIYKYQSSPYQFIGTVYTGELQSTQLTISLDESLDNQHYIFSLYAENSTGLDVGKMMVVYENGSGWDHRFRIGPVRQVQVDFDRDGKTDIAIYRASSGGWYIIPSSTGVPYGVGWGADPADIPVPGDYDGDAKTDIAVYRASTGGWYIIPSLTSIPYGVGWGADPTDIPTPGDYDGDAKTDIAVYRASNGGWYIIPSSTSVPYGVGWGADPSDVPVPGDYDGDAKTDIAVYRASTGAWYIIPSLTSIPYGVGWGADPSDIPVPGDYDGDGETDIAVYRASTGAWYIIPSLTSIPYGVGWGGDPSDIPVPGDYDGDAKADIAVYRASTGAWYIIPSLTGVPYGVGWGGDVSDIPITQDLPSILQ